MPLGDGLRMERMVPIGKNIFVEQKLFFYYHIALFS
jgi:hypothetical protein